jgi:hypothetical protein
MLEYDMADSELGIIGGLVGDDTGLWSPSNSANNYSQKLIKESYLRFLVENLDSTYDNIVGFVKHNKGFIQKDNSSKNYGNNSRVLTIRIPTKNFQNVIDSIAKDVNYFDEKRITLKDVTEEFIDIEARLKAKKSLENRYLNLLSKANTVSEILEIEKELSKIREEIESREGRLNYLKDKVAFSTLTVEFYTLSADTGVRTSYGKKMWDALKSGVNALSSFFLGILNIWPFVLLVVGLIFVIKKRIKKRK